MDAAEKLKSEGNAHFAAHRVEDAVRSYRLAADRLLPGSAPLDAPEADIKNLRAVIHSNLSHALFSLSQFDAAADAAQEAVAQDPTLLKAWIRLVRSQLAGHRSFEALVVYLVELLTAQERAPNRNELKGIVSELESDLCAAVGLAELHLGLRARRVTNGVTAVAATSVPTGAKLFAETRLVVDGLESPEQHASSTAEAQSTESLLLHFGRQLRRLFQDSARPGRFEAANRALSGSWPRRAQDVAPVIWSAVVSLLRDDFTRSTEGEVSVQQQQRQQLDEVELHRIAHLALVCRYNCFHTGFFRTSALLNHSCCPNAAMKFVPRTETVHMVAVSPVAVGDELTVKYLSDADYIEGVARRRELLYHSWLFWCECPRCVADNCESASCEWKKCARCGSFVHCPTPSRSFLVEPKGDVACSSSSSSWSALSAAEADTLTVSSRSCGACGELAQWSREDAAAVYRIRDEASQIGGMVDGLPKTVELWRRASPLVHSDHWIFRVILYHLAVAATPWISHCFEQLLSRPQDRALFQEISDTVLKSVGCLTSSDGGGSSRGGDVLHCLLDLWKRICTFYPWSEGWALHCGICRLVVINLCASDREGIALGADACIELLCRHAPFIGAQEKSCCLRVFAMYRVSDRSEGGLLPRVVKRVKQALDL